MSTITKVFARQIFDSRGNPTVQVDLHTQKGRFHAEVPSGASTGSHEAIELRDGGTDYGGKGVFKAVSNVNDIIGPALIKSKLPVTSQKEIDDLMIKLDGTPNKGNLGANAILGVSMAVTEAAAADKGLPLYAYIASLGGVSEPYVLPCPAFNVVNGGAHAGNPLAFQEFFLIPTGASSFVEAMKMATETYHILKKVITKKYGIDAVNVGDEGGFAPNVSGAEESLDLVTEAIKDAGYTGKIQIGFDAASSEFYKDGKYDLDFKNPNSDKSKWLSGEELAELYYGYCKKYDICLVEDPFDEDDFDAWAHYMKKADTEVVGDDLLVMNKTRIQKAIDMKACNALLLKVNQIGTISESIEAVQLAKSNGWGIFTSHRSGETESSYIADLTVGLRTGLCKSGAPCRSERLAKYNQFLRIEEALDGKSIYAGPKGLAMGQTPPALLDL